MKTAVFPNSRVTNPMPELPEVETTVRASAPAAGGPHLYRSALLLAAPDRNPYPGELQQRLHGQQVEAITRRAKYLLFHLSAGDYLIIHLKMTGHLSVVAARTPADKHTHTLFLDWPTGKSCAFVTCENLAVFIWF
jgi:formamidopyrimidine-DNA glycosylase